MLSKSALEAICRALKWKEIKRQEFVGLRSVCYGARWKARHTIQTEGIGDGEKTKVYYFVEGTSVEFQDPAEFIDFLVRYHGKKYPKLAKLALIEDKKEDKKEEKENVRGKAVNRKKRVA